MLYVNMTCFMSMVRSTRADKLYQVIRHIRPLFRYLYKAVDDHLVGTGVTIPMRGVMETLSDRGALTVPGIARELEVKRQVVQETVDQLRQRGWVQRSSNEVHKRSWLIDLTPEGRAVFAGVRHRENAVAAQVAASLSLADLDATLRVLSQMKESFRAIANGAGTEGDEDDD